MLNGIMKHTFAITTSGIEYFRRDSLLSVAIQWERETGLDRGRRKKESRVKTLCSIFGKLPPSLLDSNRIHHQSL